MVDTWRYARQGLPTPETEEEREILKEWTHNYTEDRETQIREPWERDSVVENNVQNDDGGYRRVTVIHDTSDDEGERWIESNIYYSREQQR